MQRSLAELDAISVAYEETHWVASKTRKGKARHVLLHAAKTLGKLATVVEKWEHGLSADEGVIAKEVVPELLMYALMLAREEGVNVEECFLARIEMNEKKVDEWRAKGLIPDELPHL